MPFWLIKVFQAPGNPGGISGGNQSAPAWNPINQQLQEKDNLIGSLTHLRFPAHALFSIAQNSLHQQIKTTKYQNDTVIHTYPQTSVMSQK